MLFELAPKVPVHDTGNVFLNFLEIAWIPIVEVVVGLLLGPQVKKMIEKMAFRSQDKALVTFLGSAANMCIIALSFILAAEALGVKMNSVISLITALGLGIALALKGNMANVAGGIQILITKPFKVGDYIRISSHKGYVTALELMFTTIHTDNDKEVVIPNSTVVDDMIINYSQYPCLRLKVPFQVGLGKDYAAIKEKVLDLTKEIPYIDHSKPCDVIIRAITSSYVDMAFICYVTVDNLEKCKHKIYETLANGLVIYNTYSPSEEAIKMLNPVTIKNEPASPDGSALSPSNPAVASVTAISNQTSTDLVQTAKPPASSAWQQESSASSSSNAAAESAAETASGSASALTSGSETQPGPVPVFSPDSSAGQTRTGTYDGKRPWRSPVSSNSFQDLSQTQAGTPEKITPQFNEKEAEADPVTQDELPASKN